MTDLRFAAVVPTYNNPLTVEAAVAEVRPHVELVIVVDDGSGPDGRAAIGRLDGRDGVAVLHHARNRGKGAAVKTGLAEAARRGFTHVLQIDADGQHDVADVPRFLAIAREQPSALVLGVPRFDHTRPGLSALGHRITNFWTWIEVGGPAIEDPQCGFRVYPTGAALRARARGDRMDFDLEVAVRMQWLGVPIVNVPTRVRYLSRADGGVSHFKMGRDNLLISWMHTRLTVLSLLRWIRRTLRIPSRPVRT